MAMVSVTTQSAEPGLVLRNDDDGVVTLTLNRPRQYNALSQAMLAELQQHLDELREDSGARVVILAAAGRAFCAGHDLKEMRANPDQAYYESLFNQCSRMMQTLARIPQPVIARVHGIATAAGCQLVAACDLAVASIEARFAVSGIKAGLFCSTPGVALARNVPRKRAFEMLFTGKFIDAETAAAYHLINQAVPPAELDAAIHELAGQIREKPPAVIGLGKALFYRQVEKDLAAAYADASARMACNMMLDETAEGIDAFIGKRAPNWQRGS